MIGQQISHYSIVEKLGEGGMGEVYLAQDLDLKRSVALKILPPEVADDPERLARFRREAESLAAINHPNIVTIFSIEQVGDLHIMTMERIEGRGLDELLSEGDMPLDQLLDVGVALSKALAAAHEKGITHRDLKPANDRR
jgi:serine/threonine protein kinase